jgi:hypothetical protein
LAWTTCFGGVSGKPGPVGDPNGTGKCCSGPRSSKQVLYRLRTRRLGTLEQPSGAR